MIGYRHSFELMLPQRIRQRISPGDFFRAEIVGSELVLRPTDALDPAQGWYWTAAWQQRERQAEADIKTQRLSGPFRSVSAFMKNLKRKK